tara:strand:- start:46 stop:561 length:516 start_codon:yes stop_codon:yes gene_type:complete
MNKLKKVVKEKINSFFDWINGAELIELKSCNIKEDPVRPELNNKFRTSYGRKIFGVRYKEEICAIMCFGFTNEIPTTVKELELMTKDAYLQSALRDQNVGRIAIAYTVWSKKKGGGKLIVKEVFKKIKKSNHLNRLITLSPLTEMARNFHLRNGATELQVNEETQNFEYKI